MYHPDEPRRGFRFIILNRSILRQKLHEYGIDPVQKMNTHFCRFDADTRKLARGQGGVLRYVPAARGATLTQ